MFLWIKTDAEGKQKKSEDLTEADFEEVTCRTDKLSMYCELGKVREIMLGRILNRIKQYSKTETDIPSSVTKKLHKLEELFQEKKKWFKCSCETRCSHNCANQELRDIVLIATGISKPEFKEPEEVKLSKAIKTKQDANGDSDEENEYDGEAFDTFNHVSITYEDRTLNELCSRLTNDLNETPELKKMLSSYREWILLGRHAEKMLSAFVDARIHCWDNTQLN